MSQVSGRTTVTDDCTTYEISQELRDRAVRLAIETRRDPASRSGALTRIAEQTGVGKEALRTWVRKAVAAQIPVETVDAEARIRQLEPDNRELRRSNEILKSPAAYFGKAEFDRLHR